MDKTEKVKCASCGSNESELLFVGHDRLHGVPGEFNVVQCRECSLVCLNPRPTWIEMEKYYPADYVPHKNSTITSPVQRLIRSGGLSRKRRIVRKQKLSGTLLDVGCATGDFLQLLAQDGNWKLFGVEPNAQAARHTAQVTGAKVFCGRLEDIKYAPHSFDIVTMWHVLEHLYDPRSTLSSLRHALKPDGRLILAVPILDSIDAKLFGPYWSGYDVPRHLFTYSMTTLSEMLTSSGFSSIRFESFIGGYDAFRISLSFWTEECLRSQHLQSFIRSSFQSIALRLLMLPYFAAVNRLGRGSTIVVTARLQSNLDG